MFIVIEGMDGSGKSTQIALLKEKLLAAEKKIRITREPGGTPIGEMLREIVLSPENKEMAAETEALLYAASRAQHVSEVINPSLARGEIVISDRYVVSSYVYQGIARNLGMDAVKQINDFAIKGRMPDLTIFLFVGENTALQRKIRQKELDRLESESDSFHQRVNNGFRKVAEEYKFPKLIIQADGSPEEVHDQIWERVKKELKLT
ncbi:MAG: dTMP kinase [Eubacteriales bacterium]|nr:dTMP kinase [Eubacteriales bacterium]